jgi:gamma-glutamyltranspeptidase/glutathione hydrolase
MVCAVDHLAAQAGLGVLRAGGNAIDAAIATNAVLAVTAQHMCGMGGDLLAIISVPGDDPIALNASGFAGHGADPDRLRAAGHTAMPRHSIDSVTVPGCVDGWLALHERFGTIALADLFAPARQYADEGFPASPTLVRTLPDVAHLRDASDYTSHGALRIGAMVQRPGVSRALGAIVKDGRAGFYQGEFGAALLELGEGLFAPGDLARPLAGWAPALRAGAWGREIWTVPPNSQGYLTLASAAIAAQLDLPDPDDPLWAHYLIESARQASYDRPEVLFEGADGPALVDERRLAPRRNAIDPRRAARLGGAYGAGDTTAITVVDGDRLGITIVQSNATGFGARIVVPGVRIFLHNRGLGFSLQPGHPAELAAGRRPPHTLCPTLVTTPDGSLAGLLGTAGGDSQPQFLLQLLARWLHGSAPPGEAIGAGRWSLAHPEGGDFNAWDRGGQVQVLLEEHTPTSWDRALLGLGHQVQRIEGDHSPFGLAHLISIEDDHFAGATDPRALTGAVAAY